LKWVCEVRNATVISYSGNTIEDMYNHVNHDELNILSQMDIVVLHLGTNDIKYLTVGQMVQDMQVLVSQIQEIYEDITICISAILPRPRDFKSTWDPTYEFNNTVRGKVTEWGVRYLATDQLFLRYDQPKEELYIQGRDNLHPSIPGAITLANHFTRETSLIRKELNIPTHKKAPFTKTVRHYKPDGGYTYANQRQKKEPIIFPRQDSPTYAPKKEKYCETQARIKARKTRTDPETIDYETEEPPEIEVEAEEERTLTTSDRDETAERMKIQVTIAGLHKNGRDKEVTSEEDGMIIEVGSEINKHTTDSEDSEKKTKKHEKEPKGKKKSKSRKKEQNQSPKPVDKKKEEGSSDSKHFGSMLRELITAHEKERSFYQQKLAESEEKRWRDWENRQEEKRWYEQERRNMLMRDSYTGRYDFGWDRAPPFMQDRRPMFHEKDQKDYEEFLINKYNINKSPRHQKSHSHTRSRSRSKESHRSKSSSSHRRHSRSHSKRSHQYRSDSKYSRK